MVQEIEEEEEADLPIDIQAKKLLDWLISRRICKRDWHDQILPVRTKIGAAIGDMPEHQTIKELLSGAHINYFHCKEIVEILRETEKDSKNFFGIYGSKRMKDWNDIVSSYERDSLYLAEAAQLLSQSVNYEIPGLKKSLMKCTQIQEECDKKEKEFNKRHSEILNDFAKSCRQLGINENKTEKSELRTEIIRLLKDLPETYEKIAESSQKLRRARNFYLASLKQQFEEGEEKLLDSFEILPNLEFLIEHGNVTTYEWIHREPPLSIEEPVMDFGPDKDENNDEVDDEIDFGELETGGEIDWGNLGENEDGTAIDEIKWDDDGDDEAIAGITVESGGVEGGVARDSEALSILDNRRTRLLILDDLEELGCFLRQRLSEVEKKDNFLLTVTFSSDDEASSSAEDLKAMISKVDDLISDITAGKMHHFQLIRSSPKYVDRIVESLRTKLKLAEKMKEKSEEVSSRRDEAIKEQADLQKKIKVIMEKTKVLQTNVQNEISKRYKNRKVNIMGGVQSL